MTEPRILVIETSVKLNGDAYKKLAAAGFIVLRGNPDHFHVLGIIAKTDHDAVFASALESIDSHSCESLRAGFARRILKRFQEAMKDHITPVETP